MRILIAGDFAPRIRLAAQIENKKYSDIFPDELMNIVKSFDYSIVNLECPITDSYFKKISKIGPNFRCSPLAAEAIRYVGFKGVTIANNHILDYGVDGLHKTVKICREQELDIVGVGENLQDAIKPLFVRIDNQTLAIINCCEHEFSVATVSSAGANPINPVQQFYQIKEAREKADFIIVITHGGHEYFNLPSLRMVELYRYFIDAGADAVINHHQHCYSGYERYKGKPIFYGLGNFGFDGNRAAGRRSWHEGYMVELNFFQTDIHFKIHPYLQYEKKPCILMLDKNAFHVNIDRLNRIISNPNLLSMEVDKYYLSSTYSVRSTLEPVRNKFIHAAQMRHILPTFLSNKYLLELSNIVNCESHRDKLVYYLNSIK